MRCLKFLSPCILLFISFQPHPCIIIFSFILSFLVSPCLYYFFLFFIFSLLQAFLALFLGLISKPQWHRLFLFFIPWFLNLVLSFEDGHRCVFSVFFGESACGSHSKGMNQVLAFCCSPGEIQSIRLKWEKTKNRCWICKGETVTALWLWSDHLQGNQLNKVLWLHFIVQGPHSKDVSTHQFSPERQESWQLELISHLWIAG